MANIEFTAVQPWAMIPERSRVNRQASRAERDLYRDHFRYKRVARLPTDCPPWVLGQELGWIVRSPVSIRMHPLDDIELGVSNEEELRLVGRKIGRSDMWQRGEGWISTADTDWLRFYDYSAGEGRWESMFVPNGSGTVEWRLGWAAHVPDGYFLMVSHCGFSELTVPTGVLPAKTVNEMSSRGGISIAVKPIEAVTLQRGQPIARVILLHADSVQASSRVTHYASMESSRLMAGVDSTKPGCTDDNPGR